MSEEGGAKPPPTLDPPNLDPPFPIFLFGIYERILMIPVYDSCPLLHHSRTSMDHPIGKITMMEQTPNQGQV